MKLMWRFQRFFKITHMLVLGVTLNEVKGLMI